MRDVSRCDSRNTSMIATRSVSAIGPIMPPKNATRDSRVSDRRTTSPFWSFTAEYSVTVPSVLE